MRYLLRAEQYNDIRQECGFKNVIIANRMSAESNKAEVCPFLDSSETETFQKHKYSAYYSWVVLHELFGHGTGKMMIQEGEDKFNFDVHHPPINPLTGKPITSWYGPGQTWTGQFGDLATTVDECRAELVGAYLMDDQELLSLLGFTSESDITAEDRKSFSKHSTPYYILLIHKSYIQYLSPTRCRRSPRAAELQHRWQRRLLPRRVP